jgi:hypothetical protein
MDHTPAAGEVRTALEAVFAGLDPAVGVELLGTIVLDHRRLVVVVRDTSTGQLNRTYHDVEDVWVQAGVTSLDRLVDEVLHGAVHYQDLSLRDTDRWGVREWR